MDKDDSPSPTAFPELTQMVTNAGRAIFEQGTPAFQAFYIEEGRVEVSVREGEHTIKLAELGPGEIFGEMSVLENQLRTATVTALEQTTVSVLKREDLEARINNIDDKFVRSLIAAQTRRLRDANNKQMHYYLRMAELQNHLLGLVQNVGQGIDAEKRDDFTREIVPLMEAMEKIVKKYQV